MSNRNEKYPALPFIGYGIVKDRGFFVSLPFKAISLNEYRKIHFGKIATEKAKYKAIIDVIMVSCLKTNYIEGFGVDGVKMTQALFDDKVELEWYINFLQYRDRDPSNYTQKIMLDAMVQTGVITDDSIQFIVSDKVTIGTSDFDMVTILMLGKLREHMIKSTMIKVIDLSTLKKFIGV